MSAKQYYAPAPPPLASGGGARAGGRLGRAIEKFYGSSLHVDLLAALAAGLLAGAVLTFLKLLADIHTSVGRALLTVALPTLCLYFGAALLLHRFWQGDLRRFVPSWFLLPVLGAALSVIMYSAPAIISGWSDPFTDRTSVFAYALSRWRYMRAPLVLLSLLTWPVTLCVHLFGPAVRWILCSAAGRAALTR